MKIIAACLLIVLFFMLVGNVNAVEIPHYYTAVEALWSGGPAVNALRASSLVLEQKLRWGFIAQFLCIYNEVSGMPWKVEWFAVGWVDYEDSLIEFNTHPFVYADWYIKDQYGQVNYMDVDYGQSVKVMLEHVDFYTWRATVTVNNEYRQIVTQTFSVGSIVSVRIVSESVYYKNMMNGEWSSPEYFTNVWEPWQNQRIVRMDYPYKVRVDSNPLRIIQYGGKLFTGGGSRAYCL